MDMIDDEIAKGSEFAHPSLRNAIAGLGKRKSDRAGIMSGK
ncbi:hypothetical protein [Moorena producens]|nr:hypothetical protein [Moorena producens]